jgi:ABC-type nitrate/sulfonate/bicarbonate transport system permease component
MNRNYRKLISPMLILAVWEAVARLGWIDPWFLPPLTGVFKTLVEMVVSGELILHTAISLGRAVSGYAMGAVVGVSLGLLIAWSKIVEDFFDPLIELIRPLSAFALIPIFFLWFGIGDTSKIMIIFKSCFFPIVINTIAGIKGVDNKLIMAARSLGADGHQMWTRILLPSALPMITGA